MNAMEKAKLLIEENIKDAIVHVTDLTGTADHVGLLVASDEFQGKILIDQHQIIMDILKNEFSADLHAVQIKTMTIQKYNDKYKDKF